MDKHRHLDRRDFLKLVGAGVGGTILACRKSNNLVTSSGDKLSPVSVAVQTAGTFPAGTLANLILANGNVLTVDPGNTVVQSVAISGDKILMTGTTEEILALAAPDAQIIDLAGRTVTPGLIDSHLHFRGYGLMTSYYMPFLPPDVIDIPGMQYMLADVIKGLQPGEWINGYYMGLKDKPIPTKE
ncbi:hypothetical protein DRH14_05700, partial [Candidatus Shapirobacteria bacterium]